MTDRQTDGRGKNICLPTLKGGDIMINYKVNHAGVIIIIASVSVTF